MPIHRLDEEPTRRGTLQDVTCDSDGKIDRFVGDKNGAPSLELHEFRDGEPYMLGVFLTGAYQEILGDLHNLFGDTNAVHVRLGPNGGYEVTDLVHGDTVTEVLNYVQFRGSDLLADVPPQGGGRQASHAAGGEHVHRRLRRRPRRLHVPRGRGGAVTPPHALVLAATAGLIGESAAAHLLVALAAILVATQARSARSRSGFGQPAVLGELIAGVLLGGSVLGIVDASSP